MIKNKKTYYQLILDKSGSMNDCVQATVNGFNEQMQMIRSMRQRYPEQEFLVSLTTFNNQIFFDLDAVNPENVKDLAPDYSEDRLFKGKNTTIVYKPYGMTALYDAIGQSIKRIRERANEELINDMASVVVVIITDGHENSSKEYSFSQIQSMIKELELSDNWTFSYLSNTPDAVDYAKSMNIKEMNALRYSKQNLNRNFEDICFSISSYAEKKQHNLKEKNFLKSK
jgi:hypothetical protein